MPSPPGAQMKVPVIDISGYNYPLPDERVARFPLEERDSSKLLVYREGHISSGIFRDLPSQLPGDSVLVFNNTRVINARLLFRKDTGAAIEIFCLEPHEPPDYERSFASRGKVKWTCLVGNLRKWKTGRLQKTVEKEGQAFELFAEYAGACQDVHLVEFTWEPAGKTFAEILEMAGETPIPPYLQRASVPLDRIRYQTIYAHFNGSVAAPTAGLHFTDRVFQALDKKSIDRHSITLHVGAGTFRPVQTDNAADHPMHTEHFVVQKSTLERFLTDRKKIIATGTTSVRTLESLYWAGIKVMHPHDEQSIHFIDQWEWRGNMPESDRYESMQALITYMEARQMHEFHCETRIMIAPGYRFRMTDGMITNFHQPRSTLLLLVSAFIGDDWKRVYEYALANEFRFLSYGDSSLLLPSK